MHDEEEVSEPILHGRAHASRRQRRRLVPEESAVQQPLRTQGVDLERGESNARNAPPTLLVRDDGRVEKGHLPGSGLRHAARPNR